MTATSFPAVDVERRALLRRGLRLEWLTVGWNLAEAVVSVAAGLLAGSIALIGFGLDSVIESFSGAVMLWRLRAEQRDGERERLERRALRLVGLSLFALAAYVAFDAARSLWQREAPEQSYVGMAIAVLSLIVMPLLARAKRRVAARLGSAAMHADSRQTDICAYLSAILLAGLALNAALGWWWADPVAALAMVPLIAYEGSEAVRGKTCCDTVCA